MITIECPRCQGRGEFKTYMHIRGGVCFRCEGAGTVTVTPAQARRIETQAARMAEEKRIARNGTNRGRDYSANWTPGPAPQPHIQAVINT